MRIAMLEVSHWHASMYLDAVRNMSECTLLAVSDRRGELARLRAEEYGCRAYTSSEELLDEEKPDFVFIFGEHAEMVGLISMAERVRWEGLYRATPLAELLLRRQVHELSLQIPYVDWRCDEYRFRRSSE